MSVTVAFVDLEKAFDRVPREVNRWARRKAGVEEWLVKSYCEWIVFQSTPRITLFFRIYVICGGEYTI